MTTVDPNLLDSIQINIEGVCKLRDREKVYECLGRRDWIWQIPREYFLTVGDLAGVDLFIVAPPLYDRIEKLEPTDQFQELDGLAVNRGYKWRGQPLPWLVYRAGLEKAIKELHDRCYMIQLD